MSGKRLRSQSEHKKKDLPKSIKSSATRLSQQPQIQNWLLIGMKVNRSSNCGESGTQLRIRMHERKTLCREKFCRALVSVRYFLCTATCWFPDNCISPLTELCLKPLLPVGYRYFGLVAGKKFTARGGSQCGSRHLRALYLIGSMSRRRRLTYVQRPRRQKPLGSTFWLGRAALN